MKRSSMILTGCFYALVFLAVKRKGPRKALLNQNHLRRIIYPREECTIAIYGIGSGYRQLPPKFALRAISIRAQNMNILLRT
ncbi:uncharacterized protein ARMOST_22285 [Armillaria ostoyae]|uniref:Uncharacterized protein n=1 Tax=Armillaria ostoyae TaxID=47428 RepID=A0A284SCF9_ARMOS|nr:uncharacterized protein ARMOST_22285 [Armillaria ostoyae]